MSDFESDRLTIFEESIQNIAGEIETAHGDFVFSSFTQPLAVDDGYREADYVIDITIANSVERSLVIMASEIVDDERVLIQDTESKEAMERARRYASEHEHGAYFGLTDGNEVRVESIDPDVRFQQTESIDSLSVLVESIIHEERRINDSREFVEDLKEYHGDLVPYVENELRNRMEDPDFEERIRSFLVPIGMGYDEDDEIPDDTVEMLSQQATYLLIDKVLFYYLILENEVELRESLEDRGDYDHVFEGLKEEPPAPRDGIDEAWAADFWDDLEHKFDLIQEINYEPIFDPTTSPMNAISLSGDDGACFVLNDLMDYLYGKEELSNLFDGPLLAKIYEGLIPPETRWKWGQIYTPPEITRLITNWAVQHPDDKILDPACGTGRFLVSAYNELADLKGDNGGNHQEIIEQIHGIDINQFPAHLATMSLVAMNLGQITEEVNIDVRDFFLFDGGDQTSFAPTESRVSLTGQSNFSDDGGIEGQGAFTFDKPIGHVQALLMNPPYTRQEALDKKYKSEVRKVALSGIGKDGSLSMDKQAAFYVYFMTHATKFLDHSEGRFGMIIQNSWMDALYGKDVQQFLLDNYEINAIIGTQRHRMIKTADVNTVILLLEPQGDSEIRDQNKVKFVNLKKDIAWFEENYSHEKLLDIIDSNEEYFDSDLRILSRTQEELREERKWGRYIRAPDIYFEKVSPYLTKKLNDVSDVSLGLTSGYNPYFYLDHETIEEWGIENKYLRPLIKSPKECSSYRVDHQNLSLHVLDIQEDKTDLEGTNVLEYIQHGESEGIHERPFFENASLGDWYKRPMFNAPLLQPYNVNERHFTCINELDACVDKRLVCIDIREDMESNLLFGFLNSTLGILIKELFGRTSLGEGALDNSVTDAQAMKIIDPELIDEDLQDEINDAVNEFKQRDIHSVFKEIGADDYDGVSIDQVNDNRRQLDKLFMEDLMSLTKREQLDIYRGVVMLVRDRLEKAQSAR